jgi:protein SCO1/2
MLRVGSALSTDESVSNFCAMPGPALSVMRHDGGDAGESPARTGRGRLAVCSTHETGLTRIVCDTAHRPAATTLSGHRDDPGGNAQAVAPIDGTDPAAGEASITPEAAMKPSQRLHTLAAAAILSTSAWGIGGDFELTADDRSTYALSDSRGQVVVLAFGYTFCPDVCPTALSNIAYALRHLGDDAEQVDALFVSLDPDRDTPDHLAGYTDFFHPRLRGLTGTPEALADVAARYRVRYEFVGKGQKEHYALDHSANLYVIGRDGRLLRMLPHGLPVEALVDSLGAALAQPPEAPRTTASTTD